MRHILSILVENEAGALSRVAGLFSARGYNIETLTVAPTEDTTMSRMTIVTTGSDEIVEQITKQLNKLVDVVKVVDLSEGKHIERELMLVKVRAAGKDREEIKRVADIFRGPHHRRHRQVLHDRAHRHHREARRLPGSARPDRHPGNRPHRRIRHRARRVGAQGLTPL
jgi:acetolactate synthase small subunit